MPSHFPAASAGLFPVKSRIDFKTAKWCRRQFAGELRDGTDAIRISSPVGKPFFGHLRSDKTGSKLSMTGWPRSGID